MDDLDKTLVPPPPTNPAETGSVEATGAKTAQLPQVQAATDKSASANKEEAFLKGQSRILQMIAANAPLNEILKQLVLLIEAQSPDMLCSVLFLSDDGNHIRHGAAPSLPENYVTAIDGAPIGPRQGSCGTAMYRGEPVIVSDTLSDPLWEDYRDLAAANGLRACWSTPIMSGRGKVLGSFAMYYHEPRAPSGDEASLTNVAIRIAGLAIERNAAKEILARTQAELAQATHAASAGKAAASIADDVNDQLEAILNNTQKCLELLDEDQPELANFRGPLKNIERHNRHALGLIARIRTSTKK